MNSLRSLRFAARPAIRKLTTSVATTAPTINIASTAPSPTMLEQTGMLMNRCLTQNLQLLDMLSDADFKKNHTGIEIGSVVIKGSAASLMHKSICPLALITESYKHALHIREKTVVVDNSKEYLIPMDETDRKDVIEFTKNLQAELKSLLQNQTAHQMDLYVRFPPRDRGGTEFDVQSSLHKELTHTARNYVHYCSIVCAIMKHMKYDAQNTVEMPH